MMHIHNHGLSLELLAVGNNANSPGNFRLPSRGDGAFLSKSCPIPIVLALYPWEP